MIVVLRTLDSNNNFVRVVDQSLVFENSTTLWVLAFLNSGKARANRRESNGEDRYHSHW